MSAAAEDEVDWTKDHHTHSSNRPIPSTNANIIVETGFLRAGIAFKKLLLIAITYLSICLMVKRPCCCIID